VAGTVAGLDNLDADVGIAFRELTDFFQRRIEDSGPWYCVCS
jgi:hypothetical protein